MNHLAEQQVTPLAIFVKEMNRFTKSFHLKNTKFTNPHGLADRGNRSTAFDIATLAFNALKDDNLSAIVSKQEHECITYVKRRSIIPLSQLNQMSQSEASRVALEEEVPFRMVWRNSNKLLGIDGFGGVKTGITSTAGPCLCILYENKIYKHKLITVVLGC